MAAVDPPIKFKDWSTKVDRKPNFKVGDEFLGGQRTKAVKTLENDMVDLRGISWNYLKKFWTDIKEKRRFQQVQLYIYNNSPHHENGITCRKLDQSDKEKYFLINPFGMTFGALKSDCKEKKPEQWTVYDLAKFCISEISNDRKCTYLDTLFAEDVGEPFVGSYVVVPSESTFESLMNSLARHFKKSDKEDHIVWLNIFCNKKNDFFTDTKRNPSFKSNEEKMSLKKLRQTKLYTEIVTVTCKMIDLFDERLIYVDDWKHPTVLTKAYCLWEIFGMISCYKGFAFIYDSPTAASFYNILADTDSTEIDSNLTVSADQRLFDANNIFTSISSLEPTFLKCSRKSYARIIIDGFAQLPKGFSSMIELSRKYLCKEIAVRIDDDIVVIMDQLSKLDAESDKKVLGICSFLGQAGVFMRNIGELNASAAYLLEAINIYKVQHSLSEDDMQTVSQAIPTLYLSLARTRLKQNNDKGTRTALKRAFQACDELNEPLIRNQIKGEIDLFQAHFLLSKGEINGAVAIYEKSLEKFQTETNKIVSDVNALRPRFVQRHPINLPSSPLGKMGNKNGFDPSLVESFSVKMLKTNESYNTVESRKIRLFILLADIYRTKLDKVAEAESYYYRAIDVLDDLDKNNSLEFGQAEFGIASIKFSRNDFKGCTKSLSRALPVLKAVLGECHPTIADALTVRAECYQQLGDGDKYKLDLQASKDIKLIYWGDKSNHGED